MRPAILDFTNSGNAVIQLPNYGNISFLENFGYSKIREIEADIKAADTAERADFLRRYIKAYKESFHNLPASYLDDAEDEVKHMEMLDKASVCFHQVKLLHSSAWYIFNRVPVEIAAVRKHLWEIKAAYVAAENIEEVVRIIRNSMSPDDAYVQIKAKFGLTQAQARYIVDTRLSRLTSWSKPNLDVEKADYQLRLKFLKKLL